MKEIKLSRGHIALVSDEDYERVIPYKWFVRRGYGNKYYSDGYVIKDEIKIKMPMHHFIIGKPVSGLVVDHINGIGIDNRRENLRFATVSENAINRPIKVDYTDPNINKGGYRLSEIALAFTYKNRFFLRQELSETLNIGIDRLGMIIRENSLNGRLTNWSVITLLSERMGLPKENIFTLILPSKL